MKRAAVVAIVWLASACAPSSAPPPMTPAQAPAPDDVERFAALESRIVGELAVADPRIGARAGVTPARDVLHKIVTAAILDEDESAAVRDGALDVFAVRARARVLERLDGELEAFRGALPESSDRPLARPKLERELVARMIDEERARAETELGLGDGASEIVRGIVGMWSAPRPAMETNDRDAWLARRLREIARSLRDPPPRVAPSDLDDSLLSLERLLVPAQFPRALAALSELHAAIDADARPRVRATPKDALAVRARTFLGVEPSFDAFASTLDALRAEIDPALAHLDDRAREATTRRARELLFASATCPPPPGTIMRAMKPPIERSAICGALRAAEALAVADRRLPALIALHDYVAVATWTAGPPAKGARVDTLSFRADDDLHDTLMQLATARPIIPLAAGLAVVRVYNNPPYAARAATNWIAFGDAPLDVIAKEFP